MYESKKKEFDENGIVFFKDLVGTELIGRINEYITNLISKAPQDANQPLTNMHLNDDNIASFCCSEKFVDKARYLLDSDVKIFSTMILVKNPHCGMVVPWHQDAGYDWPLDDINCASLWLALDDITEDNGALEVALKGHLAGELPMLPVTLNKDNEYFFETGLTRNAPYSGTRAIPDKLILNFKLKKCTMKRGELFFFHSMLPHKSQANFTNKRRCAFIVRYIKKSAKIIYSPDMPRELYFRDYKLYEL